MEAAKSSAISRRMMLGGMTVAALSVSGAVSVPAFGQAGSDRRRWYEGDYRIVQTNLREIDALQNRATSPGRSRISAATSSFPTSVESPPFTRRTCNIIIAAPICAGIS